MYSIFNGEIVRDSDGARIPANDNSAHKDYLEWIAQGNTAPDISPIVSAAEQTIIDFESEVSEDEEKTCFMVMRYITKLNTVKGFTAIQKDAMMADVELAAILQMLKLAGRPGKAKSLIVAYSSELYYTAAEKQVIIDYITAKGY